MTEAPPSELTEREQEVAAFVGMNYSVGRIAALLCVSRGTVQSHINNAARKLPGRGQPYYKVMRWAIAQEFSQPKEA